MERGCLTAVLSIVVGLFVTPFGLKCGLTCGYGIMAVTGIITGFTANRLFWLWSLPVGLPIIGVYCFSFLWAHGVDDNWYPTTNDYLSLVPYILISPIFAEITGRSVKAWQGRKKDRS